MERTDGILRILRTEYVLSLDKGSDEPHSWQPVLRIFAQSDQARQESWKHNSAETLRHIISDTANTNSLRLLLNRARENARGAQDQITKEVWEQVNHVYHSVNNTVTDTQFAGQDALHLLDSMTEMVTLYKGVTSSTMPRSMGWSFMNLGKYTERCMITLDITDRYFREIGHDLNDPSDILYWRQLLLSLSGYELHLKSYRTGLHTRNVADQVFFNRHFTRSIRYSLDKIGHYLQDVTETNLPAEKENLQRVFGRLHSRIRYSDLGEVESRNPERFIAEIRHDLLQFTKLLTQVFFSYA
jgi:uncharacterized alpha-E superfamily protein